MYKNVLVGVDFRQGGRDAIALARTLMDPNGSMTLVHVHGGFFTPTDVATPGLIEEERERGERELQAEREQAGVTADIVVAEGATPGRVLHEHAERNGADLIVLGSCHRGALGRAMLGDDTRAALNGAPCAVAVAPAGYAEQPKPLAKIGVGYNGSPDSEVALQTARDLAASTGGQIVAFYLVSLPGYAYGAIGAAVLSNLDAAVEEAEKELQQLDGVEGRAEYGLSSDLADLAADVDLLVVGSRGYGPWGRIVHGSTSSRLARHTRGPLLIVPRPTAASGEEAAGDRAGDAVTV